VSGYFELPARELFWHSVIHRCEYAPFAERLHSESAVRRIRYGWAALEFQQLCYLVSYTAGGPGADLYATIVSNTPRQTDPARPMGYAQWRGTRSALRVLAAAECDPYTPSVQVAERRFAVKQLRRLYQDLVVYLGPEPPPVVELPPSIITRRVPRVRPRS
jgi:hypothetical protein